jgi:hypothetical protein
MAKVSELCCWTLEWNNPHTQPPDNQPRVLIEEILPRGQEPEQIKAAHILGGLMVFTSDLPTRHLSAG